MLLQLGQMWFRVPLWGAVCAALCFFPTKDSRCPEQSASYNMKTVRRLLLIVNLANLLSVSGSSILVGVFAADVPSGQTSEEDDGVLVGVIPETREQGAPSPPQQTEGPVAPEGPLAQSPPPAEVKGSSASSGLLSPPGAEVSPQRVGGPTSEAQPAESASSSVSEGGDTEVARLTQPKLRSCTVSVDKLRRMVEGLRELQSRWPSRDEDEHIAHVVEQRKQQLGIMNPTPQTVAYWERVARNCFRRRGLAHQARIKDMRAKLEVERQKLVEIVNIPIQATDSPTETASDEGPGDRSSDPGGDTSAAAHRMFGSTPFLPNFEDIFVWRMRAIHHERVLHRRGEAQFHRQFLGVRLRKNPEADATTVALWRRAAQRAFSASMAVAKVRDCRRRALLLKEEERLRSSLASGAGAPADTGPSLFGEGKTGCWLCYGREQETAPAIQVEPSEAERSPQETGPTEEPLEGPSGIGCSSRSGGLATFDPTEDPLEGPSGIVGSSGSGGLATFDPTEDPLEGPSGIGGSSGSGGLATSSSSPGKGSQPTQRRSPIRTRSMRLPLRALQSASEWMEPARESEDQSTEVQQSVTPRDTGAAAAPSPEPQQRRGTRETPYTVVPGKRPRESSTGESSERTAGHGTEGHRQLLLPFKKRRHWIALTEPAEPSGPTAAHSPPTASPRSPHSVAIPRSSSPTARPRSSPRAARPRSSPRTASPRSSSPTASPRSSSPTASPRSSPRTASPRSSSPYSSPRPLPPVVRPIPVHPLTGPRQLPALVRPIPLRPATGQPPQPSPMLPSSFRTRQPSAPSSPTSSSFVGSVSSQRSSTSGSFSSSSSTSSSSSSSSSSSPSSSSSSSASSSITGSPPYGSSPSSPPYDSPGSDSPWSN